MSFAHYMELALYTPGLGYYAAGAAKLGGPGDFVTAPELTPLFGATLARQLAQILALTAGDVVELGAGSGRLAAQLLTELDTLGALPARYRILDRSADLVARQRDTLEALPPRLRERVIWMDALPESIDGVVIGNELLDALPVELICRAPQGWMRRGVICRRDAFAWDDRPLDAGLLADRTRTLDVTAPYVTEMNLAAEALIATLARRLNRGALLFVDYGFGAGEYYHPQRREGTLMCHYRHRAHADPFFLPGLQDITAHVDFSAMARAAVDAGVRFAGYTSQARFLTNLGITDLLLRLQPGSAAFTRAAAPVQKLLSPAEMGELFKAIAFTRDLDQPLVGFATGGLERLL